MLGLEILGQVAHRMEDLFKDLEGGAKPFSPDLADLLLVATDALEALMAQAHSGGEIAVNVEVVLEGLETGVLPEAPAAPEAFRRRGEGRTGDDPRQRRPARQPGQPPGRNAHRPAHLPGAKPADGRGHREAGGFSAPPAAGGELRPLQGNPRRLQPPFPRSGARHPQPDLPDRGAARRGHGASHAAPVDHHRRPAAHGAGARPRPGQGNRPGHRGRGRRTRPDDARGHPADAAAHAAKRRRPRHRDPRREDEGWASPPPAASSWRPATKAGSSAWR